VLVLVDLARGRDRLGGSVLAQTSGLIGGAPAAPPPDLDEPQLLKGLAAALAQLREEGRVLAYHDRSDGGLAVTVLEMGFAGHCGLEVNLMGAQGDGLAALFAEEPGVVLQVRAVDAPHVLGVLDAHGVQRCSAVIGRPLIGSDRIRLNAGSTRIDESWEALKREWSETSFRMRALRDDPRCAREEFAAATALDSPPLTVDLVFDPQQDVAAPYIARGARPRIAVLREQGVNSQSEMAAVFHRAGFEAYDLHMTDLIEGRATLAGFHGLVACGGFSYGDVLGAGEGWAKSILFNPRLREMFAAHFARSDAFALGVCNGCQMMAQLAPIIPGAAHWPRFVRNRVEQFEGRLSLVEVLPSPSVLLAGMAGSVLPIVVSHGEGRAEFRDAAQQSACEASATVGLRYVERKGVVATRYPANPNGSPDGLAALCNLDGRVTIAMPHPERVYRNAQLSWRPDPAPAARTPASAATGDDSGWMRMFRNARVWLG
jgi:phosphoribosylformylglycinamidine synthase